MRSPKALLSLLLAACLSLAPAAAVAADAAVAVPASDAPEAAVEVEATSSSRLGRAIEEGKQLIAVISDPESNSALSIYAQGGETPHLDLALINNYSAYPDGEFEVAFDLGFEVGDNGCAYLWMSPESDKVVCLDAASLEALGQGVLAFADKLAAIFGTPEEPVDVAERLEENAAIAQRVATLDWTAFSEILAGAIDIASVDVDDYALTVELIMDQVPSASREELSDLVMPTVAMETAITIAPEDLGALFDALCATLATDPAVAEKVAGSENIPQLEAQVAELLEYMVTPLAITIGTDVAGSPVFVDVALALDVDGTALVPSSGLFLFQDFDEQGAGSACVLWGGAVAIGAEDAAMELSANAGVRVDVTEDNTVTLYAFADSFVDNVPMSGGFVLVNTPVDADDVDFAFMLDSYGVDEEGAYTYFDIISTRQGTWVDDGTLNLRVDEVVMDQSGVLFDTASKATISIVEPSRFIDPEADAELIEVEPFTAEEVTALLEEAFLGLVMATAPVEESEAVVVVEEAPVAEQAAA